MKKSVFVLFIFLLVLSFAKVNANQFFPDALKTCAPYSQEGSASYDNDVFNILITLEQKGDKCIYKEKIYQGKSYEMLTCTFENHQLPFLSQSMRNFNEKYKKEISKNTIFQAKMTTNAEIFQKYLADKKYCNITHSKK